MKKAHKEMRRRGFASDDPEIAAAAREKAREVKEQLKRLENQVRSAKMEKLEAETRHELRRTNIDRMNQGRRPIYLNNGE